MRKGSTMSKRQIKDVEKWMKKFGVIEIPEAALNFSLARIGMTRDKYNDAFVMKREGDNQVGIFFGNTGNKDETYIGAMHELGHIALKHESEPIWHRHIGYVSDKMLRQEIEAWEWAFDHSIVQPNDKIVLHMMKNLSSYTDNYFALRNKYPSGFMKFLEGIPHP